MDPRFIRLAGFDRLTEVDFLVGFDFRRFMVVTEDITSFFTNLLLGAVHQLVEPVQDG